MRRGRHGCHGDNNKAAAIHIKIRGRLLTIILIVCGVSVYLLALHAWRLVSSLLVHARVSRVFSWRTSVCLCSRPVVGLDGCRGGLGGGGATGFATARGTGQALSWLFVEPVLQDHAYVRVGTGMV
jgi:hypothetical protein